MQNSLEKSKFPSTSSSISTTITFENTLVHIKSISDILSVGRGIWDIGYWILDVALDIAGVGRPVVFGFLQLDNMGGGQAAEVLEELQRNLTDKMIADLPLLHGRVSLVENMIFMLHGRVFLVHNFLPGFAMNTLGVLEKNTVVRLAIQVENLDTLLEF